MHRKTSKRRQRAQLTFVYMVMTFAVVASVATLMMIVLGYRFNRYDGKVEQGGLVQFDSRPSGAEVTLDTVQLANKTASKITATAGAHAVTMTKPGYTT
ncbi:MAG TPA: PEGA domain-containing protein, partial [Candidatus Saccharimonas sp.]|nr:PEGA domain-containing protein [Candidatus Saccharimonas sp.]